jgi:hypothetical protein
MFKVLRSAATISCVFALLNLSGCGGSTGAASTEIAGTLTGLTADTQVVLKNNGVDPITVNTNGYFHFDNQVQAGAGYDVTVTSDPVGGGCKVTNGSGTVGQYSEDVSNIVVTCTPISGAVYGVVSGLANGATLILKNSYSDYGSNVTDTVSITANGAFAFSKFLTVGFTYDVTVLTQPVGQTCAITNGTGAVPTKGGITAIMVNCS